MKLYYVTLNTDDEARIIGHALLKCQLAVCVNWFPITCAYRWQEEITEESEVVLLIKTQDGYAKTIEETIQQHISYNNLIAEITLTHINSSFLGWLNQEIPVRQLETT